MDFKNCTPNETISLFVKDILVYEEHNSHQKTILPFFADGYPGIMFQETENGLLVAPHEKKMPVFFLYGQTIKPIELIMEGNYRLIIVQLYPFVLKQFFGIEPKSINDNCYDLKELQHPEIEKTIKKLLTDPVTDHRITAISALLSSFFQAKKQALDFTVRQSLQLILDHKGQLPIGDLCVQAALTERTLERKFLGEVGVSPKQFSKIIQFQQSLEQITENDYDKLTDIVYSNGFADQPHFIKVFKAFTGKTPKTFLRNEK